MGQAKRNRALYVKVYYRAIGRPTIALAFLAAEGHRPNCVSRSMSVGGGKEGGGKLEGVRD